MSAATDVKSLLVLPLLLIATLAEGFGEARLAQNNKSNRLKTYQVWVYVVDLGRCWVRSSSRLDRSGIARIAVRRRRQ